MTIENRCQERWHHVRARELRREMTVPERRLWYALRDRRLAAWKFPRQSPIGPYIVDFFCHAGSLIIEVDGRSHDDRYESDCTRQAELEARGLNVLRVSNDDVLYRIDDVLAAILRPLAGGGDSHPAFGYPLPQGEGRPTVSLPARRPGHHRISDTSSGSQSKSTSKQSRRDEP